jgi:molecular chaperone DnaJ
VDTHVSFADAALGKEIKVPTVDGDVSYDVPEGTQSGTLFRLRGKGVPVVNSRNNARGDQYVNVIVDIPKKLNDKQKEALFLYKEASGETVDRTPKQDKKDKKKFGIF